MPTATSTAAATEVPPTATATVTAGPIVLVDWQPANAPGAAFAGALGWFCHEINVGQDRLASDPVLGILLNPADADIEPAAAGILAWGEIFWPASTGEISDLDTLANEGLRADACTVYGDFWPEMLSELTTTETSYYTGIARLIETEEGSFWQVRVALVTPTE